MASEVIILLVTFLFLAASKNEKGSDSTEGVGASSDRHMEMYKKLFELKRREQIKTAEQVWTVTDYEKQYKTIQLIEEAIFPVLKQSLLKVADIGYIPGSPLPEEEENRDAIGKIFENVAFFGDILLRMPDKSKKVFRKYHDDWWLVLHEAVQFCNATKSLFSGHHATQLNLMAQEIGLIPEDEDYVNPFRLQKSTADFDAVQKPDKKKKKNRRRGPRLRAGSRVDL